ncbi:MAG TPA: CRTAC1 family protein [Planctomycetota bacterium]
MRQSPLHPFLAVLAASLALGSEGALAAPGPARQVTEGAKKAGQMGHQRMLKELERILAATDEENELLGSIKVRRLKEALDKLPEGAKPSTRFVLLCELGNATVYYGREREGLDYYAQAFAIPRAELGEIPEESYQDWKIKHGAAWLRLAETENCCAYNNADSCILPFLPDAVHKKPEGSTNAVRLFSEVMAATPPDSKIHLRAQWFLNTGMMTLGKYPEEVPEAARIPPAFFESDREFPRFRNVASEVGIDLVNLAGGSIADDFDNDGDIDLVITGYGSDSQTRYFVNTGGHFEDRTEKANLVGIRGGLNAIQADYDGDGWIDVYVPRGAWIGKIGMQPDSLLRNRGDGTFVDRAYDVGIAGEVNYPNVTAVFTDYDNDGDLDVYVGNETDDSVQAPNQLFRQNEDGTFTDVAQAAGVTNMGYTRSVVAGDYDGDGDPDLWVANLSQANRLYNNKGNGTFEDVAPKLGMTGPARPYTSWFYDFDNDGALDLLVNTFGAQPSDLAAAALGKPFECSLPALYKGDGKGSFKDIGRAVGLNEPYSTMGANVGDFDNDGFQDFYAGTGRPEARDLVPDKAFWNERGQRYLDITVVSGLGHVQKGHGRSFADFDGDGDLDVFAQMGGAFKSDLFHNALYANPGFGNRWLAVRLEGTKSNRSALGARIRADIVEGGAKRSVYRWVSTGGSFGANPLRQHLGLGKAERLERLEVHWPTSKTTQVFTDLPLDRLVHIVEGEEKPRSIVELKPVHLGQ